MLARNYQSIYRSVSTVVLLMLGLLFAKSALAVDVPSASEMLQNIGLSVDPLMRLVTAVAYVTGFFFVVKGLIGLKEFGEMRSMTSHQHSLKGPLLYLVVGSLLIFLPSSVQVGLSTFWANPNPYSYEVQQDQWNDIIAVCFSVIQLVGVIAFIRGLVILSSLGGGSGQPGTFQRGMTHIVGGIFCINIYEFIKMVFATLGVTGIPGFSQ